MEKSFLITEENLIGSIADTMLELKKIRDSKKSDYDNGFIIRLIEFLAKAYDESYEDLLYDRYFIISEEVLGSLHYEIKESDIAKEIDFRIFKKKLIEINVDSGKEEIEDVMASLKKITLVLLKTKNQKQIRL
jgi:hypothetical protein